jgi:membrane-bound serine protease (ClpP class)
MSPELLAIVLFAAGVILIFGELVLPTAGVLGILGAASIIGSIGVSFSINQWLGLAVFLTVAILTPLIGSFVLNRFPTTTMGKRVVLQPVQLENRSDTIRVGQTGVAVTELRPMGECDFDDQRVEARSEQGIIRPGEAVRIVSIVNAKPIVRAVRQPQPASA